MALDILDYPESGLRRSALAHAVREVIRAEGDVPLLRAIEVAPDLHVARVIRAAAEAACEVISVVENGTERHAGLFSVPFVVQFSEAIATQEFEDALVLASWSEPFLARLHDCGARHSLRSSKSLCMNHGATAICSGNAACSPRARPDVPPGPAEILHPREEPLRN